MPNSYPNAPKRQNSVMGICISAAPGQRPPVSGQWVHQVHLYSFRKNNYARIGIIASKSSKEIIVEKKDRAYVEHDRAGNDSLFCMTLEHDQEHERLGSRVGAN